MIVFAHPDSLDEALAAAQANVLDGMEVLVMDFISVLKSSATLVRKGKKELSLGSVHADLCPRRIESGALVPNQRFMTPLELTQHLTLPWGHFAQSASKDDFNNKVLSSDLPLRQALETFVGELDKSVWVKYRDAVFKVTPARDNVDSLKNAVKAEWDARNPEAQLKNRFWLVVKDCSGTVLKVDSSLESNAEDTAYMIE